MRLVLAAGIALFSLCSYYGMRSFNPVTQEVQHIDMTTDQEIALGLQARPEMAAQFGGLSPDQTAQERLSRIGERLIARSSAEQADYPFEFHLLADADTINAFALPGGQVFLTTGLYEKLATDGEVACTLAHEIGHVVARHGAEHMAKARLTEGLTGAAVIAAYDPDRPSTMRTAAVAAMIGQLVTLRYGRADEIESDTLGVRFSIEAGYDPRAMIRVMEVLAEAGRGRAEPPEFFSTHPNPDRRIERIQAAITEQFQEGVPDNLEP
jgi:predicted Zn-dependent protease